VNWIDALGWVAASFTLAAYSMRTMLPLRTVAIGANVFFIAYSSLAHVYPTLVLHVILLPFNIYRLMEILRMSNRVRDARSGNFDITWISQLLPAKQFNDATTLFSKGDPPDNLYYLASGQVRLVETDITIEAGDIFGEIAFFSDSKERTLTAVCKGPCSIVAIDERSFMQLYYQNPAFGMFIVRLISRRLLDGMSQKPDAYIPLKRH
jgi:hypothetical protein